MSAPDFHDDADLIADLQQAGALDAPPPAMDEAVKAAFSLRSLDAELAALTYDSAADDRALAGVRNAQASRFLTFEAPGLIVEVESTPEGGARRLVGQLTPAGTARLEVRHGGGTAAVEVDELGRFSVDGVAPGPISLHCPAAEGVAAVTTDWVIV